MARLTIALSDERHQALKEAAARRGMTIGQIIEASLEHYGIKTAYSAQAIVAEARARSAMSEADAVLLAADVTREVRER